MTTSVTIRNDGPECLTIRFYNAKRKFSDEVIEIDPLESVTFNVWNDHIPVAWAAGSPHAVRAGTDPKFFSVPPATY